MTNGSIKILTTQTSVKSSSSNKKENKRFIFNFIGHGNAKEVKTDDGLQA